ncbi:MAG: hypothetical protein R2781_07375 [Flavobacteriaceae bacterium]
MFSSKYDYLWQVVFFIVLGTTYGFSQISEKELNHSITTCTNHLCKAKAAFKLSEYYLETDEIPKAQKWLDSCKLWNFEKPSALPPSDIYSLQSELFYYFGLFQFWYY